MAETGEIVAGATVAGTFLGAMFAALGIRRKMESTSAVKPPENGEIRMLTKRVTALESEIVTHREKHQRYEIDRTEVREDINKIFDELRDLNEGVARIEGALGTQKGKR